MNKALWQNWLTTVFGLIAGLPAIVLGVFTPGTSMALPPQYTHILLIVGGIGAVGLGLVSKAFNTHSTEAQVATATIQTVAADAGKVPPVVVTTPTVIEAQSQTPVVPKTGK